MYLQKISGKKIHVRSVDTTQVQQKFNKVIQVQYFGLM